MTNLPASPKREATPSPSSTNESTVELSDWENRKARIVQDAVRQVLIEFGFDPTETREIQADMAWTRRQRIASETLSVKIIASLTGALITAALAALFVGIKDFIKR